MRPLFITRFVGLLVVVLLAAGTVKRVSAAVEPNLIVTVQTMQESVKNGGFLPVIINIRNVGDAVQTLHVYSCSYSNNWKTDNPFVSVVGGHCKKDVMRDVKLKANETYKQNETVRINIPSRDVSISTLSFRLGFTDGRWGSYNQLPTWSNPITIKITE